MNSEFKKVAAEMVFREMMHQKVTKVIDDINLLMTRKEKMEFDFKYMLSAKASAR